MLYIIGYILTIIPVLITIAMLTAIERKLMGTLQRRMGPNVVGLVGIGQPIADAVKLIIKLFILPFKGKSVLFIISCIISFWVSLVLWILIPISYNIKYIEDNVLLILALTSISVYSILFSGISANCTFSLLGSIRSSAQLISYELSFTILLLATILSESYDILQISSSQALYFNILLHWPICLLYFITILAETNRHPFDLPEAESELVSGFNTEYSSLPFAYFFLAEYSFILSQSILFTYIFLGGPYIPYLYIHWSFNSLVLMTKTLFILYIFVLLRANLPRLRYDLLIYYAWTIILPISIIYFILHIIIV